MIRKYPSSISQVIWSKNSGLKCFILSKKLYSSTTRHNFILESSLAEANKPVIFGFHAIELQSWSWAFNSHAICVYIDLFKSLSSRFILNTRMELSPDAQATKLVNLHHLTSYMGRVWKPLIVNMHFHVESTSELILTPFDQLWKGFLPENFFLRCINSHKPCWFFFENFCQILIVLSSLQLTKKSPVELKSIAQTVDSCDS